MDVIPEIVCCCAGFRYCLSRPKALNSTHWNIILAGVLGMAFLPYYNYLMEILDTNKELKKSAQGIFKQMAWAAGASAAGGVLLGPPGALVCGIAGSIVGYFKSDEYTAMVKILLNLSDHEKQKLVKKVQELVGSSKIEVLSRFIGSQIQRDLLLELLRVFVENKRG